MERLVATALLCTGCACGEGGEGAEEGPGAARAAGASEAARASESAGESETAGSGSREGETAGSGSGSGLRESARESGHVYAKTRFVWVRAQPSTEGNGWIGFLWLGGSVPLADSAPRYGPGCGTWYAIEPRGFVCVDGVSATLDPKDPELVALRPFAPKLDSAWPHEYGESLGVKRLGAIPGEGHLLPFSSKPKTLTEGRHWLGPTSTVAWSSEVEANGKPWILTADFAWAQKDRVRAYDKVTFRGVELSKGVELPIAFFRTSDRPRYQRDLRGDFVERGESFARLSWVKLSGESEEADGRTFLETASGDWVAEDDAVVPTQATKTPWEVARETPPKGRRTWMDVRVWKGWLIAYEDRTPVYATLISPGRGGTPVRGKTALEIAATPTGTFKITGKFATATMVAPHELIHSDVPWTQNFSGPHALHGAYWHDDWGDKKSAGCINASPIDGKWLYEFTEPAVPEGWHGVRWRPSAEYATTLLVRP